MHTKIKEGPIYYLCWVKEQSQSQTRQGYFAKTKFHFGNPSQR
uniref:Uncharacterized protein n=1 Tax=uncultured Desulfobacterium sp. TaxID=201089 RepID=E1YDC9_9BACT|nr:unknown protein [uncultured Desulfobacterium sp.]